MSTTTRAARLDLDEVLALAAIGPLIRLIPGGKTPADKGWPERATREPAEIRQQFCSPRAYNVGLATGNGLAVLDLDAKHDRTLADARRFGFPLDTLTARTQSGGWHLLYRYPDDPESPVRTVPAAFGAGIDVKAHRGYIVAPPSVTATGRYEWVNGLPITSVPADLLRALERRDTPAGQHRPYELPERVPAGQRHGHLVSFACQQAAYGLTGNDLARAVLDAIEAVFDPPYDLTDHADRIEIENAIRHAERKEDNGDPGEGFLIGWSR